MHNTYSAFYRTEPKKKCFSFPVLVYLYIFFFPCHYYFNHLSSLPPSQLIMTSLKQIRDKGAILAWCPLHAHSSIVALGTKDSAGGGFEDYGGDLELHRLDFWDTKSSESTLLGKSKARY